MIPFYSDHQVRLYHGKALEVARELPSSSVDCIVTSPPYYNLRDYGVDGQYGLEATPAEYVENLRALFSELVDGGRDRDSLHNPIFDESGTFTSRRGWLLEC